MVSRVDTSIADTIIAQMGGVRRLKLCTGAKHLVAAQRGLVMHMPRSPNGVQVLEITLKATDTYMVTCYSKYRGELKEKSVADDVLASNLIKTVEAGTGYDLFLCTLNTPGVAQQTNKE